MRSPVSSARAAPVDPQDRRAGARCQSPSGAEPLEARRRGRARERRLGGVEAEDDARRLLGDRRAGPRRRVDRRQRRDVAAADVLGQRCTDDLLKLHAREDMVRPCARSSWNRDRPAGLAIAEVDEPADADGIVLIEVHAAGVGFVDHLICRGEYQISPPLPFVPGARGRGRRAQRAARARASSRGCASPPGPRSAAGRRSPPRPRSS